jgi:predicted RNA-binding Zn ribbon-like protein
MRSARVRAAAALLSSDDTAKLRICGGPDCGWIYVDRSRNGLRRWCEMSVCGTREKSRRRSVRRGKQSGRRRTRAGA